MSPYGDPLSAFMAGLGPGLSQGMQGSIEDQRRRKALQEEAELRRKMGLETDARRALIEVVQGSTMSPANQLAFIKSITTPHSKAEQETLAARAVTGGYGPGFGPEALIPPGQERITEDDRLMQIFKGAKRRPPPGVQSKMTPSASTKRVDPTKAIDDVYNSWIKQYKTDQPMRSRLRGPQFGREALPDFLKEIEVKLGRKLTAEEFKIAKRKLEGAASGVEGGVRG